MKYDITLMNDKEYAHLKCFGFPVSFQYVRVEADSKEDARIKAEALKEVVIDKKHIVFVEVARG